MKSLKSILAAIAFVFAITAAFTISADTANLVTCDLYELKNGNCSETKVVSSTPSGPPISGSFYTSDDCQGDEITSAYDACIAP